MGRLDANTTQYHQGHQELPEIINDAPPPPPFHEENHVPPSEYQEPVKPKKNVDHEPRSPLSSEAQHFPPPPPNQPHSFPPPHQGHENVTQAFPPHYEETTPQSFPHGQPNMQFQQQQAFPHQFNAGGVHMGHPMGVNMAPSPSPFTPNSVHVQNQLPDQAWKSDLFDCMKDPQNAIITMFFPCVTFGQIAEVVDSGNSSCATNGIMYWAIAFCIGMPCILSCTYRTKLRSRFSVIESPAPDWLVHCLCEPCALCQEYRELKDRNLDPSIGWVGNVARQQQMTQFATAPPMQQRMM